MNHDEESWVILEKRSKRSNVWMIAALEGVKRTYGGETIINQVVGYFSELEQGLCLSIKNTLSKLDWW